MSSSNVLLANLIAVRCSNTAELRLLRFWEARNVWKGGELMSVDVLLLDEHVTSTTFFYTHPRDSQLNPEWKMIRPDLKRIEKWVLRNAFDDEDKPYLPKGIYLHNSNVMLVLS
ncbi:hypothetical protein F2Q69_00003376 [Brassica cretica]|uniref:Uncharacterized protein n=1 Tax=Brassica cretica TaxID=69181 RepID=A0A8S9PAG0_BRACR|nr:hypothetical protein F2Q69_00003376 [Brassica cretica]